MPLSSNCLVHYEACNSCFTLDIVLLIPMFVNILSRGLWRISFFLFKYVNISCRHSGILLFDEWMTKNVQRDKEGSSYGHTENVCCNEV